MGKLLERIRRRLGYLRPVYSPGYIPGMTWWQITLILAAVVIVVLLVLLFVRENYWRYKYNQNPVFVTTYESPREAPSTADSKYKQACTDRSTIDGLMDCVGFTDAGRDLVNEMNPNFADESTVAEKCGVTLGEGQAIFGCWNFYNGAETITILAAADPLYDEFAESPEVSLVHEFLHGVYYRLPVDEQRSLYSTLSTDYPEVVDEVIGLGYDYSAIDDELFARVGSEKSHASDIAKEVYARYLTKWSDDAASGNEEAASDDGASAQSDGPVKSIEPSVPANHTNGDYQSLQRCTVTKISDGDTFYVDCLPQRIRLIGVDTPESTNKHQCYGNEASSKTHELLGQSVYLESDPVSGDADTYGRYLRYVYLADGTNYNMLLIEDGLGMNYVFGGQQTKYGSLFKSAENEARSAGRGLWGACQTVVNQYGNYEVVN